ncbi:DUF1016 N-terminal domain-containing protein [Occultella glacieicola]|uniref:DUF1016 N-terminal domain-containing protein n=1 Tax=Occultella glacieicola TaxID=2518684 RepID=UPI001F446DAD|nr:DUF1016 N-terminal domain-containing protein [Occultella glacieicola]
MATTLGTRSRPQCVGAGTGAPDCTASCPVDYKNLPDDYPRLLDDLKRTVAEARWRAQRVVNTELVGLYGRLGRTILERQGVEGWSTRVIARLSTDLREEFPQMRGLSQRNLVYMRTFANTWPDEVAQQPVAQLPWGHITVLLDKLDETSERDWYATAAVEHGWSRNVLLNQIMNRLHTRTGRRRRTSRPACRPRTPSSPNSSPATRTCWTSSTSRVPSPSKR